MGSAYRWQGNHPPWLGVVVSLELGSIRGAAADKGCHGAISKTDQEIEEKRHDFDDS